MLQGNLWYPASLLGCFIYSPPHVHPYWRWLWHVVVVVEPSIQSCECDNNDKEANGRLWLYIKISSIIHYAVIYIFIFRSLSERINAKEKNPSTGKGIFTFGLGWCTTIRVHFLYLGSNPLLGYFSEDSHNRPECLSTNLLFCSCHE